MPPGVRWGRWEVFLWRIWNVSREGEEPSILVDATARMEGATRTRDTRSVAREAVPELAEALRLDREHLNRLRLDAGRQGGRSASPLQEPIHPGRSAFLLFQGFQCAKLCLVLQIDRNLRPQRFPIRRSSGNFLVHLDDVPADRRPERRTALARGQGEDDLGEILWHPVATEVAEIAACLLGAFVLREFRGQILESRFAAFQLSVEIEHERGAFRGIDLHGAEKEVAGTDHLGFHEIG